MTVTITVLLLARVPLIPRRLIDPDELEHAHSAWCVYNGLLPYRDFFEHHTPWYHYLLRPFFHWFDVASSFTSAFHFLLLGRAISLVLACASVLLVLWLGRRLSDRRLGLLAAVLLASQPVFFAKTLEMRPDVLALPLFLASLACLIDAIESHAGGVDRIMGHFLAGGISLGAAVMCTQKMLFVLPGMLAGLAMFCGRGPGRRTRLLASAAFVVGVCVPGLLTWALFASVGAGPAFIANNFLLNARWKHFATHRLINLLETSGPVLALAVLGVVRGARASWREPRRNHAGILLLCTMLGLFLGVLVMPVPHLQYYLMPIPIACLFAARGLLALIDRARTERRLLWASIATLLLAVLPAQGMYQAFQDRNDGQLASLRYVYEHTEPTDLVMDGWKGMGVFRPHAFRYFFLHEETLVMLPPRDLEAYLDALENRSLRPKLIALDKNLAALGPRFIQILNAHYTSSDGFFYLDREHATTASGSGASH